ncbi:hypothetical protein C3K47_05290 [Solitalea longa]|uniref:DinB family protein n=1 Tax=Solitalea longa TaxID=2079460 RepID=A0A2S5A5T0_9SPHI|nr:hypothetical protein [Solitalea longa]POY37938.1 hypothetical protein C3K47_05290 [Solitalea longa]
METLTVKDSRMYALITLHDMHTKFYHSVLVDISEEDAQNRLGTKANHVAWLAGSLVNERYELAKLFDPASVEKIRKTASYELFKDHKGIQENTAYPALADYKNDWDAISPVLKSLLENISTEKLDSLFEMPEMSMPYYDLITFMTHRESYCIGQIALWRRLLGYEAMKYM